MCMVLVCTPAWWTVLKCRFFGPHSELIGITESTYFNQSQSLLMWLLSLDVQIKSISHPWLIEKPSWEPWCLFDINSLDFLASLAFWYNISQNHHEYFLPQTGIACLYFEVSWLISVRNSQSAHFCCTAIDSRPLTFHKLVNTHFRELKRSS